MDGWMNERDDARGTFWKCRKREIFCFIHQYVWFFLTTQGFNEFLGFGWSWHLDWSVCQWPPDLQGKAANSSICMAKDHENRIQTKQFLHQSSSWRSWWPNLIYRRHRNVFSQTEMFNFFIWESHFVFPGWIIYLTFCYGDELSKLKPR